MLQYVCKDCGIVDESKTEIIPALPVEDDGMLGDVNDDGTIDSLDYLLLKRACVGTYAFSDYQFKRGDIDKNGELNSLDYLLLKRICLGTYKVV